MGKTRKESRATKEGTVRKGERKEGRMERRKASQPSRALLSEHQRLRV